MKNTMTKNTNYKFTLLAIFAGLLFTMSAQAATFTVNQTGDAGDGVCDATCTLRDALTQANASAAADVINFSALFNTPQTITLGGTQLPITGSTTNTLTINGPGANLLTISAANLSRVINISSPSGSANLTTVVINGVTISNGTPAAGQAGGGIQSFAILTLNNSVVSKNGTRVASGAINGAGISSINGGSLTLNNSTVTENFASGGSGVGINSLSILVLNNSTVSNNDGDADLQGTGASGGGISASNTFTMTNSIVSGNTSGNGNGLFLTGAATVEIRNSTISGNINAIGSETGGGIFYLGSGTLSLISSTISNNTAGSGGGGGIGKGGTGNLNITDSTISGNQTSGNGGGISNANSGGLTTLTNSTVSGNSGTSGGGIFVTSNSTITLTNATVSNNSAANANGGGGIIVVGNTSMATLDNTIVANSTIGGDCVVGTTGTVNASYSLIEDGLTCVNGTTSNNLTGDPNLGVLRNNGGSTFTHELLAGSIAIDKGNSALTTDQRGSTRPVDDPNSANGTGNLADIGAFEVQAPSAASVSVSGRLSVGKGAGLANAFVNLTDQDGNTRTVRTSSFGYYRFDDVEVGQSYTITINSRRYFFSPQVVTVNEEIEDLNFTAN